MPAMKTYTSADPGHPLHRLTPEQIDEIGREFQRSTTRSAQTSARPTPSTSAA